MEYPARGSTYYWERDHSTQTLNWMGSSPRRTQLCCILMLCWIKGCQGLSRTGTLWMWLQMQLKGFAGSRALIASTGHQSSRAQERECVHHEEVLYSALHPWRTQGYLLATGWSGVAQRCVRAGMLAHLRAASAGHIPKAGCQSSCLGHSESPHHTSVSTCLCSPQQQRGKAGRPRVTPCPWRFLPGPQGNSGAHPPCQGMLPAATASDMSIVGQDWPCSGWWQKGKTNAFKFSLDSCSQLNQECDQNSSSKSIHMPIPYCEKLNWQLSSALSSLL